MLKKEDVEHVANLARLKLSDDEVKKFGNQLSGVLEIFEKIDNIDVSGVEETAQVSGLSNVTRSDVVKCFDSRTCTTTDENLSNVPWKEDNCIFVPKVIGDE